MVASGVSNSAELLRKAIVPLAVVLATLPGVLATSFSPDLVQILGMPSTRGLSAQHFYGLITYPFIQPGVLNWLRISANILLAGFLIAGGLDKRQQISILLGAWIIGGVAFALLAPGHILVGPIMILGGLQGAALAYGAMRWRSLSSLWRLYVVLLGSAFAAALPNLNLMRFSQLTSKGLGAVVAVMSLRQSRSQLSAA